MVQDETEDAIDEARPKARYLLFAGVAGACLLGAGLGLWARPALTERGVAKAEEPADEVPPGSRKLQIVFDDTPAPIGKPLEVMAPHPPAAAARPMTGPQLPAGPPAGLVRVDAPAPGPVLLPPKPAILPERRAPARPKAQVAAAAPAAPAVHAPAIRLTTLLASAEAALVRIAHARPEPAPVEEVAAASEPSKGPAPRQASRKPAHKLERAHAASVKLAEAAKAAKAERQAALEERRSERVAAAKAKAEKLARAERARKTHQAELAQAKAKARREALAQARDAAAEQRRKSRFAVLAHAIAKIAPHRAKSRPRLADQPSAKPPARAPIHGSGPIRLASDTRCVSADPGAALACADPQLVAAERRMNRAYQQAEAAGVPPAELKRQQQRWIAARAAAAREAPWAVRDVYQARIAELEDMARTSPKN